MIFELSLNSDEKLFPSLELEFFGVQLKFVLESGRKTGLTHNESIVTVKICTCLFH